MNPNGPGRRFSERTTDRGGIRDPLGGGLASGCARGTPHSEQNQCVREGSYQRFCLLAACGHTSYS